MQVTKPEIRMYTINDLEQESSGPIWIVNLTKGSTSSDLSFGVTLNGQSLSILIPQTWIPVNLTEQAPKSTILNTAGFRRAVSSRMIQLIHPDDAAKILSEPRARKEQERLSKAYSVLNRLSSESTAGFEYTSSVSKNSENEVNELRPVVQMFIERLSDNTDEDSAISSLMNIGIETSEEYSLVRTKAENLGLAELEKFCVEKIAELDSK